MSAPEEASPESSPPSSPRIQPTMAGTIANWLKIPAITSGAIAVAGSFLLYFKQNELIYPRNIPFDSRTEAGVPRPEQFGIENYKDVRIATPDGESLAAYHIRPSRQIVSEATILMFHGNAGNIGHRLPIAKALAEMNRLNVLMVEYRGYGLSTGIPDEKGLNVDAQAGLDWIRNYAGESDEKETKGSLNEAHGKGKVIIYAQSIGGAVGIQLAARNQASGDVWGLILENTFLSIRKMIPAAFPPARFLAPLCHQIWPSEETLPKITEIPILFISGLRDEIVPPAHMSHLYSICQSRIKIWREVADGDHNSSVTNPDYFRWIYQFINSDVLAEKN